MRKITHSVLPCALLLTLLAGLPLASLADSGSEQVVAKPFAAQGRISLRLEAGAYTLKPTTENVIRVRWESQSYEGKDRVRTTVDVNGSSAEVRVENTPHNNFSATIEVPSRSDLAIRLTAGDLIIGDISGNKDIEMNAGDLVVEISDPNQYGKVDVGSWAGDLSAEAFQVSKGGLFRSFTWHGPGQYRLHAHLLAGDLVLRKMLKKNSAMF